MKRIKSKVIKFLKDHKMYHQDINFDKTVESFLDDMKHGLEGQESSLEMIPTYIEVKNEVPINKPVVVADAGGTHFRVAVIYFNDQKKPVIVKQYQYSMPGVKHEISKDDFFKTIASYFDKVIEDADSIGFCFSYSVEMLPNKDGRLISLSKEIKAKEVIGQTIGENLNNAMSEIKLNGIKHIVLLNDAVASLLAGVGYKDRIFGGYIGFILGTGTNCCYVEKNSNIEKKKDLNMSGSQIINTESGGFDRCKGGDLDVLYDNSTTNRGLYLFEKMISGISLGPVCLHTIHKACDERLFSTEFIEVLWKLTDLETKDMSNFLYYPYDGKNLLAKACESGNKEDIVTLYHIVEGLTERAAKLTAINLTAVAIKSGQGANPTMPICIVAEGTTFYHLKGLKNRVEFYLKQYLENKLEIYCDIINVDNATLIGAAIAGLTN